MTEYDIDLAERMLTLAMHELILAESCDDAERSAAHAAAARRLMDEADADRK